MFTPSSSSFSEPFFNIIDFNFGDRRVNSRANFMANTMVKSMGKSLPRIFSNPTDLKGAYRFLENQLVTPEKILRPHINETIKRCKNQQLVAVLQDSSDCDFDYMECLEGFNSLHPTVNKGFRIHPSLVVTESGTPLGILATTNYTRSENKPKKHRNSLPIEQKESYRWLQGYYEASKLAEQLSDVQVVSIADREGDIYECLREAEINASRKADIIIRSNHNRCLYDAADETEDKIEKKLIRCPVRVEGRIVLHRHKKDERTAYIAIRSCEILIQAPTTCKKKSLPPIKMNAVLVSELDPPNNVKALQWILLTTLPINTVEEIQRIVTLYSKRWCIEIYFKVIKSGCKIDTVRLQSPEKIENFIAFCMIIAWKTMLATYLPREYPDEPCSCMFTEIEWKLAFRKARGQATPLPKDPPRLKEVIDCVAMLGGYQKRKEPPGIQTVWRGIVKLMDMVEGYELTQGLALGQ
jgi:IS4 transposase